LTTTAFLFPTLLWMHARALMPYCSVSQENGYRTAT
jgi:hypothetical protein